MRTFYILFFVVSLVSVNSFAQNTDSSGYILDKLPPEGVLLNKGWKFIQGDDSAYSTKDFNDSKWQSINPAIDISELPIIAKAGIFWLRLKLSLAPNLQKEQLSLRISQYVASEIYINGRLIYTFGIIGKSPKETSGYNPDALPRSMPPDLHDEMVVAVRYAVPSELFSEHNYAVPKPILSLKILTSNNAFKQLYNGARHLPITNSLRTGAYIILAFLYLALFLYNRSCKAYLFFFLFVIFSIPADLIQFNYPSRVNAFFIFVETITVG